MEAFFGPVSFVVERENNHRVQIQPIHIFTTGRKEVVFPWNGKIKYSTMVKQMVEDQERNKLIVQYIKQALEGGRNLLVGSHRVAHVKAMKAMFEMCPASGQPISIGLLLGTMKKSDRADNRQQLLASRLIFATYDMCKEGTNLPHLDTLVMTTPFSVNKKHDAQGKSSKELDGDRLLQLIGRIQRREDGPNPPLVLDFCDQFSTFKNQGYRRAKFYKTQGYQRLPDLDHYLDLQAKVKQMGKEKQKSAPKSIRQTRLTEWPF